MSTEINTEQLGEQIVKVIKGIFDPFEKACRNHHVHL